MQKSDVRRGRRRDRIERGVREARSARTAAARGVCRRRRAEGRAGLPGTGRPDRGLPGRRDPRARRGLSRDGELPRGLVRQAGRPALHDRSEAARGDPGGRPRRTRRRPRRRLAKANNDVARYTPLVAKQAVSQQELDDALAAQDAARSQVEAAQGRRGEGDARSRLHARSRRRSAGWSEPRRSRRAISSDAARARC